MEIQETSKIQNNLNIERTGFKIKLQDYGNQSNIVLAQKQTHINRTEE